MSQELNVGDNTDDVIVRTYNKYKGGLTEAPVRLVESLTVPKLAIFAPFLTLSVIGRLLAYREAVWPAVVVSAIAAALGAAFIVGLVRNHAKTSEEPRNPPAEPRTQ